MKTKLLLLSSLFTCFCFGQVSNANLVAHYNFDNSGVNQVNTTMYNLSTYTANGEVPDYTQDGIAGGCVNFNGFNALANDVQLANYFNAQTDKSVTISFWMKSNDIEDGLKTYVEGFESIFVRGQVPAFYISRVSGNYQGGIASNSENGDIFLADSNEWNHMVYVYNASSNSIKGYINNVLWVDVALAGSEQSAFFYTNRFVVGAGTNEGNINWIQKAYTGKIDEMYVFSRAITASEVQALYNLQTPQSECPDGDVTLTTQAEVDAFVTQYPNCTEINGNLTLIGQSINDISGLSNIMYVNYSFQVMNTSLVNLNGFSNLMYTGYLGSFTINQNLLLTSVDGLNSLLGVGDLNIWANPVLENLNGLSSLTSVGYFQLSSLPLIQNLTPLNNISGYVEAVYISELPNLTSLGAFNQVGTISVLNLSNLPNLVSLNAFSQLTSIVNFPIVSPRSFSDDQIVHGGASPSILINQTGLLNLNEFSNLTNLNNHSITLMNNTSLTNISGLSNLDASEVGFFELSSNTSLSTCAISSICELLTLNNDIISISNNGADCTSNQEVQVVCLMSTDDFNLSELSIYPNPFNTQISISLGSDYQNVKTTLVDMTGKQLFAQVFSGNTFEINQLDGLSSGMYFVTIELENGKRFTQKIIK